MLAAATPEDRLTLAYPAIFTDQYGWGHTGTVDGAKSCAWVMQDGRTVIVATVAGNAPSTGGKVCDFVLPALAGDIATPSIPVGSPCAKSIETTVAWSGASTGPMVR